MGASDLLVDQQNVSAKKILLPGGESISDGMKPEEVHFVKNYMLGTPGYPQTKEGVQKAIDDLRADPEYDKTMEDTRLNLDADAKKKASDEEYFSRQK